MIDECNHPDEADLETDRMVDRNLRQIGARLPLPAAPTEQQRTTWKQGPHLRLSLAPGADARQQKHKGGLMRNPRFILPAGSAVAAAVLLTVMLATPTEQSVVNAATILTSLRAAVHHGVIITLTDMANEHVVVSGEVRLLFNDGLTLGELMSEQPKTDVSPSQIYADLDVTLPEDAARFPGVQMHLTLRASEPESWLRLQADDITALAEATSPLLLMYAQMFRGGLLVDLDGVVDPAEPFGQPHVHGTPVEAIEPDESDEPQLTFDVSADSSMEITSGPPTDGLQAQTSVTIDIVPALNRPDLEELVRGFVTGDATPDQIDSLVSQLDMGADAASVEEVEPGLYILTLRNPADQAGGVRGEDDAVSTGTDHTDDMDMEVQIAYRQNVGVVWLHLLHFGLQDGTVSIEFIDAPGDHVLPSMAQYVDDGRTTILKLKDLIGPFIKLEDATTDEPDPEDE